MDRICDWSLLFLKVSSIQVLKIIDVTQHCMNNSDLASLTHKQLCFVWCVKTSVLCAQCCCNMRKSDPSWINESDLCFLAAAMKALSASHKEMRAIKNGQEWLRQWQKINCSIYIFVKIGKPLINLILCCNWWCIRLRNEFCKESKTNILKQ